MSSDLCSYVVRVMRIKIRRTHNGYKLISLRATVYIVWSLFGDALIHYIIVNGNENGTVMRKTATAEQQRPYGSGTTVTEWWKQALGLVHAGDCYAVAPCYIVAC